ncbi:hypothetical protein T492DRAFT_1107679 [Pavlovales sp. CCMP2436]|nr:hypothetical protein T492DRAFT_1107679 [Pavlovales sp. CCMP2436]
MMPNLGQGGCQAIEDAHVIAQELSVITSRAEVPNALRRYWGRRLIRSATVQGLSRFASDIIIRGFDTPCKISFTPEFKMENFNYAGVVTRILQPILPIFFWVQFNFLYSGWKNNPVRHCFSDNPHALPAAVMMVVIPPLAAYYPLFLSSGPQMPILNTRNNS